MKEITEQEYTKLLGDKRRLDWLEEDNMNLYLIRSGRNMIGVPTGDWLYSREPMGPEEHAPTFRTAVDWASGKSKRPSELAQLLSREK